MFIKFNRAVERNGGGGGANFSSLFFSLRGRGRVGWEEFGALRGFFLSWYFFWGGEV